MTQRNLYLAAYDIADPARLRRALYILRDYATGGQKSVFECFLAPAERRELLRRMRGLPVAEDEDRFLLIPLSGQARTRVLGLGRIPRNPRYFYLG
jgi:CRISPR-associated protein Cas2